MKSLLLVLLPLTLLACGEAPVVDPADAEAAWSGTIAYEAGVKLGGCDVGDLDPTKPGNEIAAVAVDGGIHLIHHDGEGWHGAQIAKAEGEMIQCAIGDADPTREGNELVVVGMTKGTEDEGGRGAAHLVYRRDDGWALEPIFEDTALIHGVTVADVDPDTEGPEVVTVGFSRKARILAKINGAWAPTGAGDLRGAGKTVVKHKGGIAVANTSDSLALLSPGPVPSEENGAFKDWAVQKLARGASQGRIASKGELLLLACDDGGLRLATPDDGLLLLFQDTGKLRGAVLDDIDPSHEGWEAATAGYAKTVTLLLPGRKVDDAWTPVTLWRDTEKLHHLAGGELLETGPGLELVAVGYSGRVIVMARTKP